VCVCVRKREREREREREKLVIELLQILECVSVVTSYFNKVLSNANQGTWFLALAVAKSCM